jgi:uncharacterized protein YbjT (DUF2867 family)
MQKLKEKKANITAAAPADEQGKIKKAGISGITVELGDRYMLEKAMRGFDSLFMLLPLTEPMTTWTENIIDAAQRNKISFILRSSLMDSNAASSHFLFKVHGQIDDMVRRSGIPYAITHPNNFMQNFAVYYADEINLADRITFNYGNAKISHIDVRDIAAANAEILFNPNAHHYKEYTLTGPRALTMRETAEAIFKAAERPIAYAAVDDISFEKTLHQFGMSEWDIRAMASLGPHIREGLQAAVSGDVQLLTRKKPIFFEQFAAEYAQVWQKVPAAV